MQKIKLFNGFPCGTNSRKIYEEFAEKFGWDKRQSNQFGKQGTPLYARRATPEGFNVWAISHSNLINEKDKGGYFKNEILNGGNLINEYWGSIYDLYDDFVDLTYRVAFAKKRDGFYYFLGVYEVSEQPDPEYKVEYNGQTVWVKRYRRISENYPFDE